ncbi:hypothetical protein O3M35_002416 [Rhynocoris fuscipes]|uniref:Glucose dehydrogenase n=1 Tax=Rhynocoris fuscipes TaxID=488301 RepID=A0AAW1CR97_9HEMI
MFFIKYYWILYIYCTSAGIFSLYLFIHKQCENADEWTYYYDLYSTIDKEYDFIVVGGGSAGSIVAGRLAENKNYNVLLIEAGGEPSKLFDIPLIAPLLQQSYIDWKYETVPQESACYGLNNKVFLWPAGKILGGY